MTISFGSIFLFSRGEGFLLGSGPSRNGVRAFIIGGRRSVSVEVLIELVTKIKGKSSNHYQVSKLTKWRGKFEIVYVLGRRFWNRSLFLFGLSFV